MIQLGIIGFAHGHVFQYADEWQKHPELGIEVTGGWDRNLQRGQDGCKQLGNIKCYETLDELLDSGISAVVISSETALHADYVEIAAAKKKDIILYKPMALTMKDADRIVDAVNKNGVRFTMGWQMRVDPHNQEIKQRIESGEMGKPVLYRRRHCLSTHVWDNFEATWHNDPALNRDIFADDSSHPIDMMHWMFGMPETVSCEMSTMVNPKVPNDNGVALFKYENGLICEISCSFTCCASDITTEVYLDRGSILHYYGDNPGMRLKVPEGAAGLKYYIEGEKDWRVSDIPLPPNHGARLRAQAYPFAAYLRGEGKSICTAEEGRDSLRLVLACYLSAREGRRVSVTDDRVYEI